MARYYSSLPRVVYAVALIHWASPFTYMAALAALYNFPFTTIISTFFSIPYIIQSVFSVYVGFSLYKLKPWSWPLFLINMLLITVEQFYVAFFQAQSQFVLIPLCLALMAIWGCVWLVRLELRVPYFSPRIAWWESDPRYKITIPAKITYDSTHAEGSIMDISPGGCFIKTKAAVDIDRLLSINFSFFSHPFTLKGKVVWKTSAGVTHPQGLGIRFTGLNRAEKDTLQKPIKEFEKLSKSIKQKRKQEKANSFEQKMETLLQQKRKS